MKLLVELVILTISLFEIVKSQQQFVNFQPYGNEHCSGNMIGIGYSFLLNQCLSSKGDTVLTNTNWRFTYDKNNNIVTSQQYEINDIDCSSVSIGGSKYTLNECSLSETFLTFDNYTISDGSSGNGNITYSQVSISSAPIYTKDQVILEYHSKSSSCTSSNILYSLSLTPSITFEQGEKGAISANYYCSLGVAPKCHLCDVNNWPDDCTTFSVSNSCSSKQNNNLSLNVFCKTIFNINKQHQL